MIALLATALLLLNISIASSESELKHRHKYEDPFALLDRRMSMALSDDSLIPQIARQYFWPWTSLAKAIVAFDDEDRLEETYVRADPEIFEIKLDVRRFKPEELKVKVKDRAIIVEGKHVVKDDITNKKYTANHFMQRYSLPIGCEPEEVKSLLKSNGILSVWVPRRKPPEPAPEFEVPIELEAAEEVVVVDEDSRPILIEKRPGEERIENLDALIVPQFSDGDDQPTDQKRSERKKNMDESSEETKEIEKELSPVTDNAFPVETTTFSGKIRKKELKVGMKLPQKNETTKPLDSNVLGNAAANAK